MWKSFVAVAFVLSLLPAAALADSAFIEGTVFNKRSGVPLQGVRVRAYAADVVLCYDGGCPDPYVREIGSAAITDGNGFYAIQISESELDELDAGVLSRVHVIGSCLHRGETKTSDPNANWFQPLPGVQIRNLYIEAARRRSFDSCEPPTLPGGDGIPLPPLP